MKRLLRSILDLHHPDITQEHLLQNFTRLRDSKIEWETPQDRALFHFVSAFFQARLEMPAVSTLRDYFGPEGMDDVETFERLKDVEAAQPYIRTNFTHLLDGILERQRQTKAIHLLKESGEIITKGLMVTENGEKVKKQGVKDGLLHFQQQAADLLVFDRTGRHEGDVRVDGQEVWDEYLTAKLNKDKVWGRFTGLNGVDKVCHGLKRGELHLHAAYAGELKTTFAINWAYNLVTRYRANVYYASFEMKYEHLRRLIYTLHSANNRWPLLGYPEPLDYRRVRDGELTPEEEIFYQKVIEDFTTNREYCEFHVWEPEDDVSMDDVRLKSELLHKQTELGFIVLDHGGLMEPRKRKKNKDYVIELNSVIRDAKKLALHFNNGEGIPLLLLFQINRQGKLEAEKNEGVYRMNALAYANEAEKSADYVTTSYLDDALRTSGETKLCNLKNRDNPLFPPFNVEIAFKCRRMRNLGMTSAPGLSVEDQMTVLDAGLSVA